MTKFNAWNVIKNGLNGQSYWTRQWRDPEPKSSYDVVKLGEVYTVLPQHII